MNTPEFGRYVKEIRAQFNVERRARRMTNTRNVTLSLLLLVVSLAVWEAAVRVLGVQAFILPPPSQVVVALYRGFASGLYIKHLQVTLRGDAARLRRSARRSASCWAPRWP